jgi:probable addiction module antidote protein
MMKEEYKPFDVAEYLETPEDMAGYLDACFEEDSGDGVLVRHALNDIARAYGMTKIARDTGLGRESLYKALSSNGNPEFATVMKVIKALGLELHASTASPSTSDKTEPRVLDSAKADQRPRRRKSANNLPAPAIDILGR